MEAIALVGWRPFDPAKRGAKGFLHLQDEVFSVPKVDLNDIMK